MFALIRMNSSLNPEINSKVLPTSFEFNFFDQLKRNASYEPVIYDNGNIPIPKAPENQADKILIDSSKLFHSGDQIYKKIPLEENNSRTLFEYEDGRNLNLLNSINQNSTKNRAVIYNKGQGNIGFIR